jgi:hypothetical protein
MLFANPWLSSKRRHPIPDDPSTVAEAYFACMKRGDVGVAELFHDDARLIGLGGEKVGRAAILDFYRGVIERAGPSPRLLGTMLVAGGRVAAEIEIQLTGGASVHAVDLFEIDDGRIRSLTYFIASH